MSIPAKYDITHYEGDTYDLTVIIPLDLTLATVKFELKVPGAGAASLELYEGSGVGVDTYNATTQTTTVYIQITSGQSNTLGPSTFFYDLETTISGQVITWLSGTFSQIAQVTE